MSEDISPKLLEEITKEFNNLVEGDSWIQSALKRMKNKTATADDASLYARKLGEHASESFQKILIESNLPNGVLYYNIAERTVKPMMISNFNEVNAFAKEVQNALYKVDDIPIKAISGELPEGRIEAIISAATEDGIEFSETQRILGEPVANTCQTFYDDFVVANANKIQQSRTMKATITRVAEGGACRWCRSKAGLWLYGEHPDDVFQRHDNCRCTVTYKADKTKQDVWSKVKWTEDSERTSAILKKENEILAQNEKAAQERVIKSNFVEQLMKEGKMTSKQASILYNQKKADILKNGVSSVLKNMEE